MKTHSQYTEYNGLLYGTSLTCHYVPVERIREGISLTAQDVESPRRSRFTFLSSQALRLLH